MKRYIKFAWVLVLATMLSACEDVENFLDKAPGVDLDEDVLFSSRIQLETLVASTYRHGIEGPLPISEGGIYTNTPANPRPFTLNAGITDEAEDEVTFTHTTPWNNGAITPAMGSLFGGEDFLWPIRWRAIRSANIILERIDELPIVDPVNDQKYKDQVRGEAQFILAFAYLELMKRYGGVPIMDKRFNIDTDLKKGRNTLEEVGAFIIANLDAAIANLPETYPAQFRGRATKTAARLLKSRALLYLASPLFNSAQPYLDMGANNNLISLGSEDPNRWQLAATAAKEAIDNAGMGNFALVTHLDSTKNYKYVWEKHDNQEIVLAHKAGNAIGWKQFPWAGLVPGSIDAAWNGVGVIHNFVRKYEKNDGTPQTWDPNGGNDLNQKYAELDPRFAQTVGYNGSFHSEQVPVLQIFQGSGGIHSTDAKGGAWLKKFIPDEYRADRSLVPHNIVLRLAEAYLNYAEAINEAKGPEEAYEWVNKIRVRSGMPPFEGLTKEEFRKRVRNERDIELAFEGHRLWDIRRWKIAEEDGVMQGNMWGLRITRVPGSTTQFRYEPYVFETRTFNRRMYLHPFSQGEILKGALIQNPGY